MKTRVESVLEKTGYSKERAAKMDVDDLLKCVSSNSPFLALLTPLSRLLSAFHDIGVHFA